MEHSHIKQMAMNDKFVVIQSSVNASNSTHPNFEIDYTWVFEKGSRTYSNAFAIINHNSGSSTIDFNKARSTLYVIDEVGRYLYQLR